MSFWRKEVIDFALDHETRRHMEEQVAWIEREFAEYHEALDYPRLADVPDALPADADRAIPRYEYTRRYRKRHKTLLTRLGRWLRRLGR